MSDFFKQLHISYGKPARGRVLISEPFLFDPNFKRSVLYLAEHDTQGSLGFILNHPMNYKINEVLDDFPEFDARVSYGGPVSQGNLFFIHTLGDLIENSHEVSDGIYWGGDFDALKALIVSGQAKSEDVRFFIGYSGWSEGQLNAEIREKSWISADLPREQVMKVQDKSFWKEVLSGLGEPHRIMSNFPEDPGLN